MSFAADVSNSGSPGRGVRGRTRRGLGAKRRGWGKNGEVETSIPEELIEPCKVYVANLRPRVTERMLHDALSHYAAVEKAIIIKDTQTRKSKGYGFVKVRTQEDVEKLLNLKDGDRYIQGQEIIIQLAKKKVILPGDDGYVRRPLSDRDFDLTYPDPSRASVHMLVDDVLFKIFSYLPIRNLVRCEGVCRRWQMLVHRQFSKMTSLEINSETLEIAPPFTKSIISKLLILSGPNLKSLKVQRADFATRQSILKIIGQLCPVLEHLDVTRARGINFLHISKLASGCKNIKSFIAKNCIDFDEKALNQLLTSYPQLEKLNMAGSSVYGKNFHLLPSTLKELSIERIPYLTEGMKKITKIADSCPNIEVLEMGECSLTKKDLEYFAAKCSKITKLTVYLPNSTATEPLTSFTRLKDLTVEGESVDLTLLFSHLPQIERLSVETRETKSVEVDFSPLRNLKSLKLYQTLLNITSVLSIAKCCQLEELFLYNCDSSPNDVIPSILKGCPKMKRIICPNLSVFQSFMTSLDEIMKGRSGKLVIEARDTGNHFQAIQYDKTKIEFDFTHDFPYLYDPYSCDSGDSDYSDISFDDGWYDSDGEFPEHLFLHDHGLDDNLFEAAVMLAAWNIHDSEDEMY